MLENENVLGISAIMVEVEIINPSKSCFHDLDVLVLEP